MLPSNLNLLATAPGGVARLRKLILTLAVQGKLVRQNPKDEPASALLKKIRAEKDRLIAEKKIRRSKPLDLVDESACGFVLPTNWAWERLGNLGDWGAGATPSRSNSDYYGRAIPWFKSGELTSNFISESEETVADAALRKCSLRLSQIGDVLMTMYGAYYWPSTPHRTIPHRHSRSPTARPVRQPAPASVRQTIHPSPSGRGVDR